MATDDDGMHLTAGTRYDAQRCTVCRLPSHLLYRGACERCNEMRLLAVREFIHATEATRLLGQLGITDAYARRVRKGTRALERAIDRVRAADARCMQLRMWRSERSTRRPPWFYGDERSNTR
jgi:hypothetical protein